MIALLQRLLITKASETVLLGKREAKHTENPTWSQRWCRDELFPQPKANQPLHHFNKTKSLRLTSVSSMLRH